MRGDLDNIVLKALKKEPERRYSTVEYFSEDVRRHLAGLPVTARPDTFSYRFEKFIQRHRVGAFAALIILLAILGGVIATLWQARIAQTERAKAERRFNDVRTLANSFLFEFNPKIENLPGSLPARQLLVTRALEYLDKLSRETGGDLQLQSELAKAYEKVGDVQGNPETPNIGDFKGALESYEKALPIRRKLLETSGKSIEAKSDLANNLLISANINLNGFDFDKAKNYLAEAVSLLEAVTTEKPHDLETRRNLAKALRFSGFIPFYDGENEKSLEFYNRSQEIAASLSEEFPDDAATAQLYANLHLDIGEAYAYLDKADLYKANMEKGLELMTALYQRNPNDNSIRRSLYVAHLKNGEMLRDTESFSESLAMYNKGLELAQEGFKINSNSFQAKRDLAIAYKQRAVTLKTADREKESLESFAKAIETSEQLQKEDPNNILIIYDIAGSHEEMGETFYDLGDYQSAIASARKSADKCAEVLAKSPEHTQSKKVTAKAQNFIGKSYFALARKTNQPELWKKALDNYRSSLEIYGKLKSEGKSTEPDHKAMAEIEKEIAEIEKRAI